MNLEVIRIGTPSEHKTQILGASIFSDETSLVWHMVILKEMFSDLLLAKMQEIKDKQAFENSFQETNKSGIEFVLSQETIPCFGEVEELVNFIADEILVNWQDDNTVGQQNLARYPEILVFSNEPKNQPTIRKITTDKVDGQDVLWISVSQHNP